MLSQTEILEFASCFNGAKEFYGVTQVGEIVNGKAESKSTCVYDTPSPSVFTKHLNGDISIGISPLKADDTIEFGAIDIDNYDGDLNDIISAIYTYNLPICPCYSKSRKLHLYMFFTEGTKAEEAVKIMQWYRVAFGLDKKTEVFPKQLNRSPMNKAYSWINLPYADCLDEGNHRKMVKENGELASLGEFLERAQGCKVDAKQHQQWIETLPLYDAPPCLLTTLLLQDCVEGGRNNYLFSVAVYLKLKDEMVDLEDELQHINELLPCPLPANELRQTVISSMNKNTYFYMCSSLSHCNKAVCMKRDLGIGSEKNLGVDIGSMTQYMTDPPSYDLDVNGKKMRFENEGELLGQTKFRELCLRELHLVPKRLDDAHWAKVLTKAAEKITVVEQTSLGGDFTIGSQLYDVLVSYFGDKRRATNASQVMLGRVYLDEERKEFVFSSKSLLEFVTVTSGFKGLSSMEIKFKLEEMGAYRDANLWRLSTGVFPEALDKKEVEIDLSDGTGESNDF